MKEKAEKIDVDFQLYGILAYGHVKNCPADIGFINFRKDNHVYKIVAGKKSMLHSAANTHYLRLCAEPGASLHAKTFSYEYENEERASLVASMLMAIINAINAGTDLKTISDPEPNLTDPIRIQVKFEKKPRKKREAKKFVDATDDEGEDDDEFFDDEDGEQS